MAKSSLQFLDQIDSILYEKNLQVTDLVKSYNNLSLEVESVVSKQLVYSKILSMFCSHQSMDSSMSQEFLDFGFSDDLKIVAGLIPKEDEAKMRRSIFRASKHRASPYFFDIPEELLNLQVPI